MNKFQMAVYIFEKHFTSAIFCSILFQWGPIRADNAAFNIETAIKTY